MCFLAKEIIVLLIKCFLSRRKVNVILASDTADRQKEDWSSAWALKPADKPALEDGFQQKINKHTIDKAERRKKKGKSWGKMDRQHPQLKGRHVWLLQAAYAGTAAATGCLLIYLGLLGLRGRGLLQINATFSFWYRHPVVMFTVVPGVLRRRRFILAFNTCMMRNSYNCCERVKLAQHS